MIFKKVHREIKFNQAALLKPYIDMNTDLRKKSQQWFWKGFFNLMNKVFFGKIVENERRHRDEKFLTTERRRNYLVSEPNYCSTKFFTEYLLVIKIKKQRYLWITLSI